MDEVNQVYRKPFLKPQPNLLNYLIYASGVDWIPQDLLKRFEKETGVKVNLDVFDSNESLLAKLKGCAIGHTDMPDDVRCECPPWALDALRRRFGESFQREMEALLTPAPLDLRVNPIKSTRDIMLGALRALGLDAEPSRMAPLGIRIKQRPSLSGLPMLKDGEVEIQDEGSQLVAMLVGAKPGERVVDFCAGAGGKTLAIAARSQSNLPSPRFSQPKIVTLSVCDTP